VGIWAKKKRAARTRAELEKKRREAEWLEQSRSERFGEFDDVEE
jgi:hypothetical protein